MSPELRQKMALFRYSLIAPLLTNTFTQTTAKEYLAHICAKSYTTPLGSTKEYAPATIKEWLRKYRLHGIDGLYSKPRSDKDTSRALSKEAKDFIVSCKSTNPKRSAHSIYHEMVVKGFFTTSDTSLSTIQRFITHNHRLIDAKVVVDRRAFEFEFPNDCWQSDISVGPYLTINGKKHKTFIIAFLDDATRVILHAQAFFSDNFIALLQSFKLAVSKYGIPKKVFVDNGKVYKSDQMQLICASLGTVLCFAKPYSPQSKGKIERWFKTLHDQWTHTFDWTTLKSLDELNESLTRYINQYNKTIHSALEVTPMDKFTKHLDLIRFLPSNEELNHQFLYRCTRKVRNDATISLNTVLFEVPMHLIGETIHVRFDPSSLAKAFIFSTAGKKRYTIFPLNKLDNSMITREHNVKPVDFSPFNID